MNDSEVQEFLDAGTRTGKAAWVGADGHPHAAPIWFVRDGDDLVFNTSKSSGKGQAFRRDGRVSIVVDEETPPYAFVKINGTVTVTDDPDEMLAWATRIGARYMGEDRAEEFGERNASDGQVLVRVTPTKIIAKADLAGY